ncbi:MAG: ester cyclase [Eudoraea sp.]|nr:ester cyclase [Eudoraea sp.]
MRVRPLILLLLITTFLACKPEKQEQIGERQKQMAQQVSVWVDSCWNERNFKALEGLTSSTSTRFMNGVRVAEGSAELEAHLQLFFTAFPDLVITTEEIQYKDSLAFFQWNAQGTNTGVFGEVRPTGKRVNINGLSHLSFSEEGKIIQEIVYYNELELLQQLGYTLIPPNLE